MKNYTNMRMLMMKFSNVSGWTSDITKDAARPRRRLRGLNGYLHHVLPGPVPIQLCRLRQRRAAHDTETEVRQDRGRLETDRQQHQQRIPTRSAADVDRRPGCRFR